MTPMRLLLLAPLALLVPSCAFAQVATQQTATHLDAAQGFATANTSAATLTLTPQVGSIYIGNIHISNCAGGTAVSAAAPTSITATYGSSVTWLTWQMGSGTTAGACVQELDFNYGPGGFKAPAPGPVTITLPTFATNQTIRFNVGYWSAP